LEEIMATVTESAANAVREYVEPIRAAVEDNLRDVRRAAAAGRHVLEDRAAQAAIQVRRRPFLSLGVAMGLGTLIGAVVGYAVGRSGRLRRSD
jgi:ElaB/YqjD/DUF883 family membrane-anchored ribosome-binding protein